MPEAISPSKLTESSVIVVTSLRPRERPLLSVRQRRIAEFCSAEAGRKRRNSRRTAVADCTAAVAVSASCKVWNPGRIDLLMERTEEPTQSDDVKVLFPARDILYSDSEIALLSTCSSWKPCTQPIDTPPSRISTESSVSPSLETISERPCGRVGVFDGSSGVENRYLNKPPENFVPNDGMITPIVEKGEKKPYRQVWHSLWEHKVARKSIGSSKSTKSSKPTERLVGKEGLVEQITASANNICNPHDTERKQRQGVFHPTPRPQTRSTYRSKTMKGPWGRHVYQRAPSTMTRGTQRKPLAVKDKHLVGDSENMFERAPRTRRCEPPRRKDVPRVVVTTESRTMTAEAPDNTEASCAAHPRSAPANPRPGTDNLNSRFSRFSPATKPLIRPRFSVPIRASRVPMDLLFKEMNSPKCHMSRKDMDGVRGPPLKAEVPFSNQNAGLFRNAKQSVHFNISERNRTATLRNGRRLYNRGNMTANESNPAPCYYTFQTDAECMPVLKNSVVNDSSPPHSKPRTYLRPQHAGRFIERGPHRKISSANLAFLRHLCGDPVPSKQTASKSPLMLNFSMESDDTIQQDPPFPVAALGIPPIFHNDIPCPPYYFYDGHISNQTPTAFHFSHPNGPDVLISPPPNPCHRGNTLRVPGSAPDVEPSPVTVFDNHCVPIVNFVPRYFGIRPPENAIDIIPQPFLQHVPNGTFKQSVDLSRFGPPPRQHPEAFSYGISSDHENFPFAHSEVTPYMTNLEQAGVPVPQFSTITQYVNASKPPKMLLTFGAQVPSSERAPSSSVVCGYFSSPQVETEIINSLGPQDLLNPNNFPNTSSEAHANVQKCGEDSGSDIKPSASNVSPHFLTRVIKADSNIATADGVVCPYIEYSPCVETTDAIGEKRKSGAISATEEEIVSTDSKNIPVSTKNDVDFPLPNAKAFSSFECLSVENPPITTELLTTRFEIANTRSSGLCTCAYSDTKLSTVTERSSEAQHPADTDSPFTASDLVEYETSATVEEEQTNFQPVLCRNVDGLGHETAKYNETLIMRCKSVSPLKEDPSIQAVSSDAKSCNMIAPDVSIIELYDEDFSEKNDFTLNEHFQRISDLRSSCTESITIGVDTIENNRVMSLLQSENPSKARYRFRSLVARLAARRHIALQCKLSGEQTRNRNSENGASNAKSSESSCSPELRRHEDKLQVRRKDVCVQVPVLRSQSAETEPYTSEKGVPDCRAGLTLRLMSTLVDVPPVIKTTESIAISTEDKLNDGCCRRGESPVCSTRNSESNLTTDELFCSINAEEAPSRISFDYNDCRRLQANVSMTDKQLKRLKPFFRSRCSELANICNIAAMHSVMLNTECDQHSILQNKEKRPTDSDTSVEVRKQRNLAARFCKRHCSCNHKQLGRVPKQLTYDRRVAYRPVKRECGRLFPQADCDEATCLHLQDEHTEHHRTPDLHRRFPNKIDPQSSLAFDKKLRQKKIKTSAKCHSADVADCKHGAREETVACRRNVEEPSNVCRPSSENLDFENGIALNRKPGSAVCRKDHSAANKKGILKSENVGHTSPHIRGSRVPYGLGNIMTPTGMGSCGRECVSPNINTNEQINVNITYNSFGERSHSSRQEAEYLQSRAPTIALETAKRPDSSQSRRAQRFREAPFCSNCESQPIILVHDSSAFNQSRKHMSKELLDRSDLGPSDRVNYPERAGVACKSTVPTIFLTRAESKDVFGLEDSLVSTPSVQLASTSVDFILKDSFIGSKSEDASNAALLKVSKSSFEVTSKQEAPPFVDTRSTKVDTSKAAHSTIDAISKQIDHRAVDSPAGLPKGEDMVFVGCPEELQEDVCIPADSEVAHRKTSSPNLDAPVTAVNVPTVNFDPASPPQPLRGCVFTAMKRYMKNHQRSERSVSSRDQSAYSTSMCPGFRFTGVPVIQNNRLPIGRDICHDCCKCNLSDHDLSLEQLENEPGEVHRKMSTEPLRESDVKDIPNALESGSNEIRVSNKTKTSPLAKILWQSALGRRDRSKRMSPAPDASNDEGHSGIEFQNDSTKNIHFSVKCSRGVRGDSKYQPESQNETPRDKKDKPIQAIRTSPPDMVADTLEVRYPRPLPEMIYARRRLRASPAPGEVRIRHGRFWPPDHPRGSRRQELTTPPDDGLTCDHCQHRKLGQRIPSSLYYRSYCTDEFLGDEYWHDTCSGRGGRNNYKV